MIIKDKGPYSGILANQYIEMEDCARWRQFEVDGGVVLLTSKGQEMVNSEKNVVTLFKDLNNYKTSSLHGLFSTRKEIANGGNGSVYQLANREVVIKESNSGNSLYSALYRMDRLSTIADRVTPQWMSVVDHLALVTTRKVEKEFMIMKKIDDGVTMQDLEMFVNDGHARFPRMLSIMKEKFASITKSQLDSIRDQKNVGIERIYDYADSRGIRRTELLPDPNDANFLVTNLQTSIEGYDYKLWIIDQ